MTYILFTTYLGYRSAKGLVNAIRVVLKNSNHGIRLPAQVC
jgi:hypothetical protein